MQDDILKKIGRIHTYQDFLDTYNYARDVGFNNINVDKIIHQQDQTLNNVKETVNEIKRYTIFERRFQRRNCYVKSLNMNSQFT